MVHPTVMSVRQYYAANYLNNPDGFRPINNMVQELVNVFPSHDRWEPVLLKSTVINALYRTNIINIRRMADHVVSLGITHEIATGSPAAVDRIRLGHGIKKKNTECNFYSFATKYCYSHNRDAFPIYDGNVMKALEQYAGLYPQKRLNIAGLEDYATYITSLQDFRNAFDLDGITVDELDKFLWIQGGALKRKNNNEN